MRISPAQREAKLAKLMEIEGYDNFEELAQVILSELRLPRHLHERGLQLHLRNGAGPGRRLLRRVPHQLDALGSHPRWAHLTAPMSLPSPRDRSCVGLFFCLTFSYKHRRLHGDSHEKWKKEKSLDISAGSRPEDNGPQEDTGGPNCQEVETV